MRDITCPYCEHEWDLNHDDGAFYNQEKAEEETCPNCEKKFLVNSSITWYHEAEKAECLNDDKHDWQKDWNSSIIEKYPELAKRERCSMCHEKRIVEITN